MHEVSLMAATVRIATDAARKVGAKRITCLKLRIGTLSSVVPAAMRFAWEVASRDTIAEGARLEIETVSASSWCPLCLLEFRGADFVNECPRCHALSGELRRGRELEIVSVETN